MTGTLGCEILSSCLCGTPPFVFLVPGRLFLSPRRAKCGLQLENDLGMMSILLTRFHRVS